MMFYLFHNSQSFNWRWNFPEHFRMEKELMPWQSRGIQLSPEGLYLDYVDRKFYSKRYSEQDSEAARPTSKNQIEREYLVKDFSTFTTFLSIKYISIINPHLSFNFQHRFHEIWNVSKWKWKLKYLHQRTSSGKCLLPACVWSLCNTIN